MMPIEDQSSDDDTQNEVGLGITSDISNQNWNGDCTNDGSERDKPPLPYNSKKDKTFNKN